LRIAKATIELSRELKELHVAVAAPKKSVFGLSRMWEFHSSDTGWTCDTFTSRDEAEAWLCGKLNVSSICGHA
jgi:hypothetical protein